MNKNIWITVGVVVLIALGWFLFQNNYANGPTVGDETENIEEVVEEEGTTSEFPVEEGVDEMIVNEDGDVTEDEGDAEEEAVNANVVVFDGTGFNPGIFEVEAGTTVVFENNSGSRDVWPASAIHPTHTLYPDSSIAKCGTDEVDTIFDACKVVGPGGSYSFTFDEVGEWKYHNHLSPSNTGTIVVTE